MGTRLYLNMENCAEEMERVVGAPLGGHNTLIEKQKAMTTERFYDWLFSEENGGYNRLHFFERFGFGPFDLSLIDEQKRNAGVEKDYDRCLALWESSNIPNPGEVDPEYIKGLIKAHGLCWR